MKVSLKQSPKYGTRSSRKKIVLSGKKSRVSNVLVGDTVEDMEEGNMQEGEYVPTEKVGESHLNSPSLDKKRKAKTNFGKGKNQNAKKIKKNPTKTSIVYKTKKRNASHDALMMGSLDESQCEFVGATEESGVIGYSKESVVVNEFSSLKPPPPTVPKKAVKKNQLKTPSATPGNVKEFSSLKPPPPTVPKKAEKKNQLKTPPATPGNNENVDVKEFSSLKPPPPTVPKTTVEKNQLKTPPTTPGIPNCLTLSPTKINVTKSPSKKKVMETFLKNEQERQPEPNFLQEPIFDSSLVVDDGTVNHLKDNRWLKTNFLDFMIKHGCVDNKEKAYVIPTSLVDSFLTMLCSLSDSDNEKDVKKFERIKAKYQCFNLVKSKMIFISCTDQHFFVISMLFDPMADNGNIFKEIEIYDSIKITNRRKTLKLKVGRKTLASKFLTKLQFFIAKYVVNGTNLEELLLNEKEFILKNVTYKQCPQQENGYDCSLFAYAVLLHKINNHNISATTFIQEDITRFRFGLYTIFSAKEHDIGHNPRLFLSRRFILSFFINLAEASMDDDPFLDYYYNHDMLPSLLENGDSEFTVGEDDSQIKSDEVGKGDADDDVKGDAEDDVKGDANDDPEKVVSYDDTLFAAMVLDNYAYYEDFDQVNALILQYEIMTNTAISRKRVNNKTGYKLYQCVQHIDCPFRASFGKKRKDGSLVNKTFVNHHQGKVRPEFAKDGREWKKKEPIG